MKEFIKAVEILKKKNTPHPGLVECNIAKLEILDTDNPT